MYRFLQMVILGVASCVAFGAATSHTLAGTIIKLSLGDVSPDIEFDGTTLSTFDDGNLAGEQDTAAEFLDFLDSVQADFVTPPGSFTLDGLTTSGPAIVFNNSLILQSFTGGVFSLYDPSNVLLLSGTLTDSVLSGTLGFSSGSLFTTTFGSVTGGTLVPYIADNTLTLSMSFTDVRDSAGKVGFSTTPNPIIPLPGPIVYTADLHGFTADATVNLEAEPIPEPAGVLLLILGTGVGICGGRRVKSRVPTTR
jgi:hypothetical protein